MAVGTLMLAALAFTAPPPPTPRRAVLAAALPLATLPLSLPAGAANAAGPTECKPGDTECALARRAAAADNLKENWGGVVGVGALLVLRGVRRAEVDAKNPNSFNNAIRREREKARKKAKMKR